jgi:hypothetical protein
MHLIWLIWLFCVSSQWRKLQLFTQTKKKGPLSSSLSINWSPDGFGHKVISVLEQTPSKRQDSLWLCSRSLRISAEVYQQGRVQDGQLGSIRGSVCVQEGTQHTGAQAPFLTNHKHRSEGRSTGWKKVDVQETSVLIYSANMKWNCSCDRLCSLMLQNP